MGKKAYTDSREDRAYCEGQLAQMNGSPRTEPQPHYPVAAAAWLLGYDDAVQGLFSEGCGHYGLTTNDFLVTSGGDVISDLSGEYITVL